MFKRLRRFFKSFTHRYHTKKHMPSTPSAKNIDKATVESFNAAPAELVITLPESFDVGEEIRIKDTKASKRSRLAIEARGDKALELEEKVTLFSEDGMDRLEKDTSFVHVKSGKRFVTYRVVKVEDDGDTVVTLAKVKLNNEVGASASTSEIVEEVTDLLDMMTADHEDDVEDIKDALRRISRSR